MSRGLRLKMRQLGLAPHTTRVWIDDMEISHAINKLEVSWDRASVTEARLTITVRDLDVDAATIAQLQAHVRPSTKRVEAALGAEPAYVPSEEKPC